MPDALFGRTFRPYVQLRHHIFLLSHMLEGISATMTAGQFLYFFLLVYIKENVKKNIEMTLFALFP